MAWREFAERTPDLPIGMIIQGDHDRPVAEVVAAYEAPFPNPESKAGAQRFPLLVPQAGRAGGARDAGHARGAAHLGQAGAGGVLRHRSGLPFPKAGEQFTGLIPTAGEQVRVEGAAHFLQEDRGREIADAMLAAFGAPAAMTSSPTRAARIAGSPGRTPTARC